MKKIYLLPITFLFCFFLNAQPAIDNKQVEWINNNCIPLNYVNAGNGFDDLKPLNSLIGDARIVSLGECTHGSSEVFSMKHRLLEFLVKEKGFTIFSIEANMPEAYALNEYIIDGKADSKKLLAGMHFWTWNTQEVLDMIEWMKTYNETAINKISFTGFDMQFPDVSINILRDYLTLHNPGALSILNDYDSLSRKFQLKKNEANDKFKTLKAYAQAMIDSVNAYKPKIYNKEFNWAFQNAKILWQYAANHFSNPARDESMAENIKWILDNNPNEKIVLWAHNEHVRMQKDKFGNVRMGNYLKKWYGDSLISIGFSTEEGTYTAVTKGKGVDSSNILTASSKKSCEFIFKQAAKSNFIIDLRKATQSDEATSWLFNKTNIRTLGAIKNDKYQFFELIPVEDFDMLIFLKRTSSSRCFNISAVNQN